MAGSDGVDIRRFQESCIGLPFVLRQRVATDRPFFMPAGPRAFDRHAIPKQHASFDLYLLESEPLLDSLHCFPINSEGRHQIIKLGLFRGPKLPRLDGDWKS